jgi:PAS domain S-box-containing protein
MPENEARYTEVIKLFGLVLNQYRLYSERHPAAQLAVQNFQARLEAILAAESTFTLGAAGGRLIVNDLPLDAKQNGTAALLKDCERLAIESLTFEQGSSSDEIVVFFKLMALPPKVLQEKGGFPQAFAAAGLQHVRLGTIRYLAVGENETVVEHGEEKAPAKQPRKIEKMDEAIEHCLTGSSDDVTFDLERLGYELERNPKGVAQAMVRRSLQMDMLKIMVKAVESFLEERLAPLYLYQGRDLSQPIYALVREFKNALREVGIKRTGELVFPLERCADTAKVELMVKAYREGDQQALENSARLCRKDAREQLRDKLADLGAEGAVFDKLFPETVKRKSHKVSVPLDELEELRRIRDRFEEELALRVAQRTEVLEQEKTKAVKEKERMAAILRHLGHALVVVDVDGKVELMNPATEKLLGIREADGKGVALRELLKEEHLLVLAKDSLNDDSRDAIEEIEVTSNKDETRQMLQRSGVVVETKNGEIVGMLSLLRDSAKQQRPAELKAGLTADATC